MRFKFFLAFCVLSVNTYAIQLIDSTKNVTEVAIQKYSKLEIGIASFELKTQNGYKVFDSSSVNMYAIFTSPSGKKYRRNAFYFQPYERHFDRPNNIEIPGGNCSIGWNDVAEYEYPDANAFMVPINTNYPWRVRFALHSSKTISQKTTSIC